MGKITKKRNWESILAKGLVDSKQLPFKYGKNDCTIWSINLLKQYSNLIWEAPWKNKKEALAFHKAKPMQDRVSEILSKPRTNLYLTKRGDLVQKGLGLDSALGICIGAKVALLKPEKGICYADLHDCNYSWEI